MVVIAIPVLVLAFVTVGRHLRGRAHASAAIREGATPPCTARWCSTSVRSTMRPPRALRYVRRHRRRSLPLAIHVADPDGVSGIAQAWRGFKPRGAAARCPPA